MFYQDGSFGRDVQKLKYFFYILIEMFCFKLCLRNSFKCIPEELAHWIILAELVFFLA